MCEKFPNATQFGETARKIYSDLTDSACQIARIHPFAVPLFVSYVDWERSAFPIELVKKEPSGAGSEFPRPYDFGVSFGLIRALR